jgi:hypothetical protein
MAGLTYLDRRRVQGARPDRCIENAMHQSRLEARRCTELHLMERGGLIRDLQAHPQKRFRLDVNGVHVCDYLADFVYFDIERNREVVEDTKGFMTEVARLKLKLVAAVHGIEVEVVRRAKARGYR